MTRVASGLILRGTEVKGLLRSSYHESTKPLTEAFPWNVAASLPSSCFSLLRYSSQTTVPVNRVGSLVSSLMGSVRCSHYRRQNSTLCQNVGFCQQSFLLFFFLLDPIKSVSGLFGWVVYLFLKCENQERPQIFQSSKIVLSLFKSDSALDGSKIKI